MSDLRTTDGGRPLHPFVKCVTEFHDRCRSLGVRAAFKVSGYVNIDVTPALYERAYVLADAILTGSVDRGHEVIASRTGVDIVVRGVAFEPIIKDLSPKVRKTPELNRPGFAGGSEP